LFAVVDPQRHITARPLERACRQTAEVAGLGKTVTVHTLRHCFATHLIEQGVNRVLGLTNRNDPVTEIVAKRIIEIAQTGVHHPAKIFATVLKKLGVP
jgi:site-specific recombinase XerD